MPSKSPLTQAGWLVAFLAASYLLVALFFAFLHCNLFGSDVRDYWTDSLHWQAPFHPYHVPGYPLVIALARGLTFGRIPAIPLMMAINLVAFSGSVLLVYRLSRRSGLPDSFAAIAAVLFAWWPCAGLTFTVYPLADLPACFLFLLGLDALQRSRSNLAAVAFSLALVTHKVMWPLVALLILAEALRRRELFSRKYAVFLGLLLLPVTVLWLAGSLYHHSFLWIVSSNVAKEMAPHGSLLVGDGVLGTLQAGGVKAYTKGTLLLAMGAAAVLSLGVSLRLKNEFRYWGTALSLTLLALFVLLNQHEIWAVVRFGRLLALPLAFALFAAFGGRQPSRAGRLALTTFFLLLLLSQFAFAAYMAKKGADRATAAVQPVPCSPICHPERRVSS